MKNIYLGSTNLEVSQVALGCMRMSSLSSEEVANVVSTSIENGINFFDHADIYGGGESEVLFGKALTELGVKREDVIIQSKAGIRNGYYDFSKEHIISSVEGILTRLGTDYLDVFALHRPDALVEPEEVSEAFDQLLNQGKVRHFGVSNHTPFQVDLIQEAINQKLEVNQLQFGLRHAGMVATGMNMNMNTELASDRDGGVLDYSRLKKMTIQAWSPYQNGFFGGAFLGNPELKELNDVINEMADKYQVTDTGIATAWINRHPAKIQTVVGTMNPQRIKDIALASDITLSREDWYTLYKASGYQIL